MNKKKNITHSEACKIKACRPTVKKAAEFYDKYKNEYEFLDFRGMKDIIKKLEKKAFERGLYPKPSTVVGTALFLAHPFTNRAEYTRIRREIGTDYIPYSFKTVRSFMKDLNVKKKAFKEARSTMAGHCRSKWTVCENLISTIFHKEYNKINKDDYECIEMCNLDPRIIQKIQLKKGEISESEFEFLARSAFRKKP